MDVALFIAIIVIVFLVSYIVKLRKTINKQNKNTPQINDFSSNQIYIAPFEKSQRTDVKKAEKEINKVSILNNLTKIEVKIAETPVKPLEPDEMPDVSIVNAKLRLAMDNYCDFVVVDVETTGLSPKANKIIEISAVRFVNFEPIEYFSSLINPGIQIPKKSIEIHSIDNEMVKDSPKIEFVAQSFMDFIGKEKFIAGHNILFDLKFLYANGMNLLASKHKFVDTLAIAQQCLRKIRKESDVWLDDYDVTNYKLDTLLKYYNIPHEQAHRSLDDALGTGFLLQKLLIELEN